MSKIKVTRINHDNSDLTVVNAARVSFDKFVKKMGKRDIGLIKYLASHDHSTPFMHVRWGAHTKLTAFSQLEDMLEFMGDPELSADMKLKNLGSGNWYIEHSLYGWSKYNIPIPNYTNIFASIVDLCPHSSMALAPLDKIKSVQGVERHPIIETNTKTLLIEAPIYVLRQLMKSTVGVSYNEVSRRYVDFEPSFYKVKKWRARPDESIKQGSGGILSGKIQEKYDTIERAVVDFGLDSYNQLLENAAPEQARGVLPQNMISKLWMSASEEAFNRVLRLRTHSTAQEEIRDLAALFRRELAI